MDSVGAGLRRDVHDRSAAAPKLGRVGIDDQAKLGDRVRGRLDGLVREALIGCAIEVIVDSVEEEIVPDAAKPVDVIGAFATEGDGALVAGLGLADAWGEEREVGIAAALEWKLNHLFGCNDLTLGGAIGFEQGRGGFDVDNFAHLADAEGEIDPLAGIDGEAKFIDRGGGET